MKMKNNYNKIHSVVIFFISNSLLNNLYAAGISILKYSNFTFFLVWSLIVLSLINNFNRNLVYKVINLIFLSISVITMWVYSSEFLFIFIAYIVAFVGAIMMLFLSIVLMLPVSVVSTNRVHLVSPILIISSQVVSANYLFYFWYLRIILILVLLFFVVRYLAVKYPEFLTLVQAKYLVLRRVVVNLPRNFVVFCRMFFSLFRIDSSKLKNKKWPIVRQDEVWNDPSSLVGKLRLVKYIVVHGFMITVMAYEHLYRRNKKGQKRLADDLYRATMSVAKEFHKKTGFRWYCYTWLDIFNWVEKKIILFWNLFTITSALIAGFRILNNEPENDSVMVDINKNKKYLYSYSKSNVFCYVVFSEIVDLFIKVNKYSPHSQLAFWIEFFSGTIFTLYLFFLVIPKKKDSKVIKSSDASTLLENFETSEGLVAIKKILFEDNPEYLYISVFGLLVALLGCVIIARRKKK